MAASAACLFGATTNDLATNPRLTKVDATEFRREGFSSRDDAFIVKAVAAATKENVTSIEQAFQRVDGAEVNVDRWRGSGRPSLTAVEFGLGDNSYGAVFDETGSVVAVVNDGDLRCVAPGSRWVSGPECGLSNTYNELSELGYTLERKSVVRAAPSGEHGTWFLNAFNATSGDPANTVAEAWARTDRDSVYFAAYEKAGTNDRYTVVTYDCGDNECGAIVKDDSGKIVAKIGDSEIDACTVR